ncbi:MAG: hypothetical protein COW28_02575 [bacterium (Candidatus Ratteibacteria) CG15_BIG_FIL_POST_REV_8_21_14_020_41_12]|uniref:PpiC domain-containing protein n=1 Tax=bacterium (Candidatus Ratteibacteria) CG15_BIG_FIL_POST_REV_8_21_14_020_41_12 TaxID=2014291 RepID=A0A2M7GZB6_9BACT|nr:MAG: hypothetical protein COW28_02575 [bacterium (Candidatus Ratteibacteria) CG15_BIG_FIL_POST_REV_8_21_14_020_41_12]
MTRNFTLYSLLFTLYSLFFLSPSFSGVFKIAAVVNNETITENEVKELMNPDKDFSSALNYLIEETLLLQEAKKRQIEIDKKTVDEEFKRIKEKFSSPEDFYRRLANEGLTAHQLKEKLEKQARIQKLINQAVGGAIFVNPREIEERQQQENFPKKNFYRLSEISRKEKREVEEISRRIKNGELKFSELATDLGYFQKEELSPPFQSALATLKIGELSKPIKSEEGYALVCITEEKEKAGSQEEIRQVIKEEFFAGKFKERYQEFIAGLKKNAYIEIKQNFGRR